MADNFRDYLRKYRDDLGLKVQKLGNIAGLSKPYLHNLQNHKLKRNLSFEKLKDVIVLLSQKEISQTQENFVSQESGITTGTNDQKKKGKRTPSFFDFFGFPEPSKLDLHKFKKLLFVSTGLTQYENSFMPVESIADSKTVIKEYIEQYQLDKQKISELKHTYEVWTLSDILGETFFDQSAEETAQFIIKFKIKYRNFVPLEDNTQWIAAYERIKFFIEEEVSKSSKEIKQYWSKEDKWEKYLHFYGISRASFFVRLRIYNPYSPNAKGNYNVGGKTVNTAKFANILPTEIPLIIDRLKLVNLADGAKLLDSGKDILINELGCFVNKKIINSKK